MHKATKKPTASGKATDANRDPDMSTPDRDYEKSKVDETLAWEKATRDVWNCMEKVRPGDADGESR